MWIEDLTKALYYLNMNEYRYYLLIDCIKDNVIYFTNGTAATVQDVSEAYDRYIKEGIIIPLSTLVY